jgi:hypothetical protein
VTAGPRVADLRALWERRLRRLAGYLARTAAPRRDPGPPDQHEQTHQLPEEKP